MIVAPPREISNLVYIEDGKFCIDESATIEQKKVFDEWVHDVEELEENE